MIYEVMDDVLGYRRCSYNAQLACKRRRVDVPETILLPHRKWHEVFIIAHHQRIPPAEAIKVKRTCIDKAVGRCQYAGVPFFPVNLFIRKIPDGPHVDLITTMITLRKENLLL